MESLNKYREQLKQLRSVTENDSVNVDLIQYGITEQYYNDIVKAVDLIVDFEEKYLNSHNMYNSISNVINDVDDDDIKLCVLVDIMRCYNGLNHSTSFMTPEGVALLILVNRIYKIGSIKNYEELRAVSYSTISIIDIIPYISECSYELGRTDSLLLSDILVKESPQTDNLYRLLIYNICKKIAEVDDVLSVSEKEWLEKIARLDDDDITNDIDISLFD